MNEYDTAEDKIKKIKYGMTFQDMNMLFGDAYYVGFTSSGLWFRHYVAWSVHEDGIKTVCAVFETPTINNWWNRRAATLTRAGYSMITDDKTEIHYVVDQMKYTDEDFHLSDEQIDYFEQLNKELQEKATVN